MYFFKSLVFFCPGGGGGGGGEPGIFLGFSFIFSLKSSALDHSATAPPYKKASVTNLQLQVFFKVTCI